MICRLLACFGLQRRARADRRVLIMAPDGRLYEMDSSVFETHARPHPWTEWVDSPAHRMNP